MFQITCGVRRQPMKTNNRLIGFWIVAALVVLLILLLYPRLIVLIPLAVVAALVSALLPTLLGALAGLVASRFSVLAGSAAPTVLLLLWLAASPPLKFAYDDYVLTRSTVWHDYRLLLALAVSLIWYAACGAIGGEIAVKLRKKLTAG